MHVHELEVNPRRMLWVTITEHSGGERELAAVTCAYVPAVNAGGETSVAIEVVWDPFNPSPDSTYTCPTERLSRVLMPPGRVKRVRPYRG
ncbi:MAG: hypothetical protein V2A73_10325 [Pseudomonadota bacterium]